MVRRSLLLGAILLCAACADVRTGSAGSGPTSAPAAAAASAASEASEPATSPAQTSELPTSPMRGSSVDVHPVGRVRTDPDDQGLFTTYSGGCELSAALRVEELADRVEVATDVVMPVVVGGPDDGMVMCPAVLRIGMVHARLAAPLGDRPLVSEGVGLQPFDGAALRDPEGLPTGYAVTREAGVGTAVFIPEEEPTRTATWSRYYSEPAITADTCEPSHGSLEISQGPLGAEIRWSAGPVQQVDQDGVTLDVRVDDPNLTRQVSFTDAAGMVAVINQASCWGDELLSEDELIDIALSLARP